MAPQGWFRRLSERDKLGHIHAHLHGLAAELAEEEMQMSVQFDTLNGILDQALSDLAAENADLATIDAKVSDLSNQLTAAIKEEEGEMTVEEALALEAKVKDLQGQIAEAKAAAAAEVASFSTPTQPPAPEPLPTEPPVEPPL